VKTLQDPAGQALSLSAYRSTTVGALRGKAVRRGPGGSRGAGVESTVYQVRASLVEAKLESDSDSGRRTESTTPPAGLVALIVLSTTYSATWAASHAWANVASSSSRARGKVRLASAGSARSGPDEVEDLGEVAVGEADDRVRSAVVNGDALSVDERRGREDDVRGVATCARPAGSR
jgi:hypothetical protein